MVLQMMLFFVFILEEQLTPFMTECIKIKQ